MPSDLLAITEAYKDKFGSVPPFAGLSEDAIEHGLDLLEAAIESGEPIASEADWYDQLNLDPPPEDALT